MADITDKSFTTTITVDESPEVVFAAVNNVRGWWKGDIAGNSEKVGDEFTYRHKDVHYSKQKVTESLPGKRVVWHVMESQLNFVEEKNEWNGTDIIFEIAKKGAKTELSFTHVGLVPAFECFGGCSGAWSSIITRDLRQLITQSR
jgi:Activator of Hsp90 ATPase homolog 1-like protein